jgi:hypothetical protein
VRPTQALILHYQIQVLECGDIPISVIQPRLPKHGPFKNHKLICGTRNGVPDPDQQSNPGSR